ncbi:MAG: Uma2 family endonuclease [Oligoflexales bacterium]|nr:Uma2 family endonuclease [Oligoflexales bacterium]
MDAIEKKTINDLLTLPDEQRAELIDGKIVLMEPASSEHSRVQLSLGSEITNFQLKKKSGSNDYWVTLSEAWTQYDEENTFVHDIATFASDQYDPKAKYQNSRPEWICEVMSPSNWNKAAQDLRVKLEPFGVPFYWMVDLERKGIIALKLGSSGKYEVSRFVGDGELIELEPFEGLAIDTGALFKP